MAKAENKPAAAMQPDIATKRAAIMATCGGWEGASDETIAHKWANTNAQDRAEMLKVLSQRAAKEVTT